MGGLYCEYVHDTMARSRSLLIAIKTKIDGSDASIQLCGMIIWLLYCLLLTKDPDQTFTSCYSGMIHALHDTTHTWRKAESIVSAKLLLTLSIHEKL